MATERQSPDVLLEQTNLTGTVSEIQDDPDSADADWLDAVANNVASICRTSFPTPTGNPTVGADLQEFRVLVRKYGGTGTPTAWIELYENGVLIRAGSAVNVTGDLVISFTWNANEIGTPDGSYVECRLNSTAIGGSPSGRACVEVGAVEWNVVYSAAIVVTPSTASLITSLFAPTISITNNQLVTPSVVALIITSYAPTIQLPKVVTPSTLALILTPYIPSVSVSDNKVVTPTTLALGLTKYAPVIAATDNKVVTPDALALILSEYAPTITITDHKIVIPSVLALVLSTLAPVITIGGGYSWTVETLAEAIKIYCEAMTGTTTDARRDITDEGDQAQIIADMKVAFPTSTAYYKHHHYHGGANQPCVLEEV